MDQTDELSLWLADAWLRTSGDEIQSFLVEDLQEQAAHGTSVADGLAALSESKREAGDFGMEIAGTLLAPVLVQLLKDFWAGYLKKLGENAGAALADATTKGAKAWFLSLLAKKQQHQVLAELQSRVDELVARKKLSRQEANRLLEALRSRRLVEELAEKK